MVEQPGVVTLFLKREVRDLSQLKAIGTRVAYEYLHAGID